MPDSRLPILVAVALAACLAVSSPARAELVVLTDGEILKVALYETDGEQAVLAFDHGGRLTLPIGRIERVVDDEVIPAPEPAAELPPASPVNLAFEESQPVPEGPFGPLIYDAAKRHALNPRVVAALVRQESAGNPRALSRKGARGLMQLMPATASRFGVRKHELYTPEHNVEAGVRYLRWLADRFPNDLARILAAYNAGEGAVERYGGIPPYRETRDYVRRIYTNLGLAIADLPLAGAAGR
jgi:soluble lytic murein transglycosylase-like protein